MGATATMALGFSPPTKEGVIMTDFEMLSLIVMIAMLIATIIGIVKKGK